MKNAAAIMAALGAAPVYKIARSLRLHDTDLTYLNRTLPGNGDRQKWTFSCWIKRVKLGTEQYIFQASDNSSGTSAIRFMTDDTIKFEDNSIAVAVTTTAAFKDTTAFMHLCVMFDTTNATANDRMQIWVNGVRQAVTYAGTPALNASGYMNLSTQQHRIGTFTGGGARYCSLYLAEVAFINSAYALPSTFSETDLVTGALNPKDLSGITWGTTGFWLDFSDNSATTSSTLGKDRSGNNNDWTPNNFSVTAGAGNDSVTDTPTNYGTDTGLGGEVRGNYCVLNALNSHSVITLSNGNLDALYASAAYAAACTGTFLMTSGGWRWEMLVNAVGSSGTWIGICRDDVVIKGSEGTNGVYNSANAYFYNSAGQKWTAGAGAAYGSTFTNGDTVAAEYNATTGALTFFKNGVSQGVAYSGLTGAFYPCFLVYNGANISVNFGQKPFASTATAGFKALCSHNLSSLTVALPATFTGNANADGPFIWANGIVASVTINGNVATEGTHFRKVAGGIKLITTSTSYNTAGSNTVTAATYGLPFKYARAQ